MHSQSMSKSILDLCIWVPEDLIDALPFLMRAWSCLVFALTIGATGKGNFSHQIIKQLPSRFDLLGSLLCGGAVSVQQVHSEIQVHREIADVDR